jgi:dUTP pyrophosphatase
MNDSKMLIILKKIIEKTFPLDNDRSELLTKIDYLIENELEELGIFPMYDDVQLPDYSHKKGDSGFDIRAYLTNSTTDSLISSYHNLDLSEYNKDIHDFIEKDKVMIDDKDIIQLRVKPGAKVLIPTGIKMNIPEGYEIQVRPRSGISAKTGLFVCNAPGTVDANYVGELKIILMNLGNKEEIISHNDRIAQLVLCKVTSVKISKIDEDDLKKTDRSFLGFGSTGLK